MSERGISEDLRRAIEELSALDRIVVASDYDGCVAPIQPRPDMAVPNPASIDGLRACAELPNTLVALVSGRARDDLAAISGAGEPLILVGSHGAEFDTGFDDPVTGDKRDLLDRIVAEFEAISSRFDGTSVEVKPASTTLHVRNATTDDAGAAMELALTGPAAWQGVEVTKGKAVVELAVIETSKGLALDRLRESFGADAVLYIGDDVTDEKAFAHLNRRDAGGRDVGVKVGSGHTVAEFRVDDTDDVPGIFELITAGRRTSE